LIEVFTAQVGMTPKRLSRVLRFQRACHVARQSPTPDWARVAQVCGYFDQSHLIRDIRELSGFSPVQLLGASQQVKDNHAAVAEGSNSSKPAAPRVGSLRACGNGRSSSSS
jgi:AraC-like DNA-binding protein